GRRCEIESPLQKTGLRQAFIINSVLRPERRFDLTDAGAVGVSGGAAGGRFPARVFERAGRARRCVEETGNVERPRGQQTRPWPSKHTIRRHVANGGSESIVRRGGRLSP